MVMSSFNHSFKQNGSPWIQMLKEGQVERILIVAIDIGKFTHSVILTNIFQETLVAPFEIDASISGFQMIRDKVKAMCDLEGFSKVVVGIETTAHYYEDLVRSCKKEGYLVRVINSATTAIERDAQLNWTKTDSVDLTAIVQSLIQGRGYSAKTVDETLTTLKKLTRFRRNLVTHQTKLISQLRSLMDQVFREFQGKSVWVEHKRQHKKPFSRFITKSSLFLMRHYPHPEDLIELGEDGLRQLSVEHNLKLRDSAIQCLLAFANDSVSRPKTALEAELMQLEFLLDSYEHIVSQLKILEKKIERKLLETDGAILLTIPGMGVITTAELTAEMGSLDNFTNANQLIKMAGTNPLVKQSGGHRPTYLGISKQGRKQFRNIVFLVGKCVSSSNPEMRLRYKAMLEKGKAVRSVYIALGNRMLRLAFAMIRKKVPYRSYDPDYCLKTIIQAKLSTKLTQQAFYDRFFNESYSTV